MRLKRRIWWWIILVVLVCLGTVGSALFRREPLLLQRATKVADVKAWWPLEPIRCEYRWLSDTRWLRRIFPRKVPSARASAEIWISRLDGREMQEAGRLILADDDAELDPLPSLQWLPSDRKLSFLYKDALWTVSTD